MTKEPQWYCVKCGKTSLDPCDHSSSYHWPWVSDLQAVMENGELLRDVIAKGLPRL